ncbi:LLM class flavin-dependent oxidoreductase [Microcoleus sp. FACHB-SPT15]|uniref:LLM class flavin-dependent oxidoreductase n=1 Tax=Microcoleus sp. FACHB-SPT15 TaxID=2692830 RepID=UPI00177AE4CC|nr:LLM class flavin-dependent oxidoreductase [Microcoleus sp. FACHB-SPT15]MBD1807585.1 LLM class flavin-dependent oxidoreductase [Microcoleus sp. FACHB-SPT15]
MRQIHLSAFLIAGHVAHSHALWRHPQTELGFFQPEIYQNTAQILEQGKFDLVFFADRLAMGDGYGQNLEVGLHYGDQDAARLDPVPVLAMMAASTQYIGLGATRSTTYYHPYQVARTFASLDHLTRGRVAWNVVTSVNNGEAQNFGLEEHLEHDQRYNRADEFMEVTFKLWDSWQEGAILLDRDNGIFADPSKVNYIHHQGEWFKSRGPLNIPRSPQGHPVIIQAGSSGRGKEFAARWAEVVFTIQPNIARAKDAYIELKSRMAEYGRAPEDCKILTAVMPFVGETEAIALTQQSLHNELVHPLVGLSTLSNHTNYDFSQHALDEPVEKLEIPGMRGMFDLVLKLSQEEGLTLGDIGKLYGASVLVPQLVGTPTQVADQLEMMFQAQACDGFVISPAYLPGAFEEFVKFVVPELQRRGIFRTEYTGKTLREHFGLKYPENTFAKLSR